MGEAERQQNQNLFKRTSHRTGTMRIGILLGGILSCFLAAAEATKQPNILFILTDDQGKYIGGLEHMPKLQV